MTLPQWTNTHGWRVAAIGLALTVALAGCSDDTPQEVRSGQTSSTTPGATVVVTTVPGGSTTTPPPSDSVEPTPPASGGPGGGSPPLTTVPVPGTGNPHRWEGYTVGADGTTLSFTYYAGVEPCSVFDSIVADESPDSVRVTIYERSGPDGVVCIMMAQLKTATITLAAPLGGRSVVDGAP